MSSTLESLPFVEETIRDVWAKFMQHFDAAAIADELYSKRVIDYSIMEKIEKAQSKKEANRAFLLHLNKNATVESLKMLCDLLRATSGNYKRHDCLAELLEGQLTRKVPQFGHSMRFAALDLSTGTFRSHADTFADTFLAEDPPHRRLQDEFFRLQSRLARIFDEHINDLKPTLRTHQKREEWPYNLLEVEDIDDAKNVQTIFTKIRIEDCWLNTELLIRLNRALSDEKSYDKAQQHLQAYHERLHSFCKSVLLKQIPADDACLEHFPSRKLPILNVTYDVNLEEFYVSKLLEQQQFLSRIFQIPKEAFHYLKAKTTESTLVTWALDLIISIKEAFNLLKRAADEFWSLKEHSTIKVEIAGVGVLYLRGKDLPKLIKKALQDNQDFLSCTEHVSHQFLALVDHPHLKRRDTEEYHSMLPRLALPKPLLQDSVSLNVVEPREQEQTSSSDDLKMETTSKLPSHEGPFFPITSCHSGAAAGSAEFDFIAVDECSMPLSESRKIFRPPLHKARTVYAVLDLTGRCAVFEVEGEIWSLNDTQTYPVLMCNRNCSNESMTAWFFNYENNIWECFKICLRFNAYGIKPMSMHVTALQGQLVARAHTYVLDKGGMSARLMLENVSSLSSYLRRKEWESILVHIATYCDPEYYSVWANAGKRNAMEIGRTVGRVAMLGEDRNAVIGLFISRFGEVAVANVNSVLDSLQGYCDQAVADHLTEKAIPRQSPRIMHNYAGSYAGSSSMSSLAYGWNDSTARQPSNPSSVSTAPTEPHPDQVLPTTEHTDPPGASDHTGWHDGTSTSAMPTGFDLTSHNDPLMSMPRMELLDKLVVLKIASEWHRVCIHLGVPPEVQKAIQANHASDVEQCCRNMFIRWLSPKLGSGAKPRTWESVLSALQKAGYTHVAEDVKREITCHTAILSASTVGTVSPSEDILPPFTGTSLPTQLTNTTLSLPNMETLDNLVVHRIAALWDHVGLLMGITSEYLQIVRADCRGVEQRCRDMFHRWLLSRKGTGEKPRTWESVLSALENANYSDVAADLRRELDPAS